MSKTKNLTLANKIKQMKQGDSFPIGGKKERESACRVIKTLKDAEVVKLNIITKEMAPGQFGVYAL